jgi:hypothetical protein
MLPDGKPSMVDYTASPLNRFITAKAIAKNRSCACMRRRGQILTDLCAQGNAV